MMMLFAFPSSSMALQPSTPTVSCITAPYSTNVPLRSLSIALVDGISYVSKTMSTRLLDNAVARMRIVAKC